MASKPSTILFFDGYCKLCNGLVDFIIKRDAKNQFHFAPLSCIEASKILSEDLRLKTDSVILSYQGRIYIHSTAAIWTLSLLGGIWKLSLILFIFPSFIRDPIYKLIAKNRYSWFGKRDTCRIPTLSEQEKFLD